AFAALLGVLINLLLYEPMKSGGVSPFVAMISSFGVLVILTNLVAIIWGSNPVVLSPGGQATIYRFGPVYTTGPQLQIIAFALVLALALWVFFRRTRLGIAIRAMGNDAELAEIVGMPARRLRHLSFAVGSGLVGVSSLLIGFNVGIIDFNMGFDIILMATVAMIIGGLGKRRGGAGRGLPVLRGPRPSRREVRVEMADGALVRDPDLGPAVPAERPVRRAAAGRGAVTWITPSISAA